MNRHPEGEPGLAAPCPRCAIVDGHLDWCTISRFIERFLTPPPPPPVFDTERVLAMVREAAREAAREAVAELIGGLQQRPDLRPVPLAEPTPEPSPEPEGTATEALTEALDESVQRAAEAAGRYRTAEAMEREAACDLFVSECIEATDDGAWITSPDLVAAYERWRPVVDAPTVTSADIGVAMRVAGYRKKQASSGLDPRFRGSAKKPMVYFGCRLRESADTSPEDHTPASARPSPARPSPPSTTPPTTPPVRALEERREERRRAKGRVPSGYSGDRPGREIPRDYAEQIVMPLIIAGWTYHKNNGNSAGKPRMIAPDGRRYSLANTPSDWRGLANAKAHLRRYLGAAL